MLMDKFISTAQETIKELTSNENTKEYWSDPTIQSVA